MDNSWLFDRFQECGDQPAIVWQDQSYSYRHLLDDVSKWQQVLAECRIDSGQCVALSGDFSFNTITLLLALIANRNIVVPLTSAVGTDRERYLDVACTGSVFEFDTNGAWGYYQNHASGDHPLLHSLRERREPGLIIFTSGSTGQFKAAVHNFSTLLSKFKKRGRAFRTLTFLRLDHMGGLNTLGYILSNRGTLVSLSSRTVDAVCQAIERHQVQLLPATPTFLNMLLISEGYKTYDLSSLETISYGTEPMHPATLDVLARTFPRVKLKQLYGLTELGILSTQSAPSDSLWVKVGGDGCEIKVVDGLLWVRAETAMLGYLNAPSP
ncbi:MAG: AMP-binding protein, partial [Anaerolineae bacterium]|nr:AMP-binding protein [Anaerolineae bacterium]